MQTQRHVFANQWLWAIVVSVSFHIAAVLALRPQDQAPRARAQQELRVSLTDVTQPVRLPPQPTGVPNAAPAPVPVPAATSATPALPPGLPPRQEPPAPAPLPDGRFYTASELGTRPRPLTDLQPDVREAILLTRAGRVLLTLWIEANGRVVSFEARPDDVPQEYATAVGEYFASIPFSPGLRDGVPVRSILKLEIRTDAAVSEPGPTAPH